MMENFFEEQLEAEASLAARKNPSSQEDAEGRLTVDVFQTEDDIVIRSTIAGVTANDIDISVTQEMVTIKGIRRSEEKIRSADFYYQELYWGPFSRSIILPEDVDPDGARAVMKNGVLTLKLPKLSKTRTRKIKISG